MKNVVEVTNLTVTFLQNNQTTVAVNNISFQVQKGEILGIVGESGSGKSVTSLAMLGLLPKNTKIEGRIIFNNTDLIKASQKQLKNIRGNQIAMIFQEPMSSLNPSLTCGYQVLEMLQQHTKISTKKGKAKVISLFNEVKLPRAEAIFNQYPHQLSGGQKQRVMIAMALACNPKLLIADEPTTALDVTVQKEIIGLLKELQQKTEMSIVFISHDLSLVSEIANNVIVMYQGEVVEQGSAIEIFKNPKHTYTKALINAKPNLNFRLKSLPTVENYINNTINTTVINNLEREANHQKLYSQEPLLKIENVATYFELGNSFFYKNKNYVKAVDGVSFTVFEGETLGLVGESGCGKTTLGRTILNLETATRGHIYYKGKEVTHLKGNALKAFRREVQIIFQDPFSSLNPRIPVGKAIMEPMIVHNILNSNKERKNYVLEILEKVGLEATHFNRYPHEFSGGQRQRVGIARTIALNPKLIICDESVSALDVSVQAQVLNLLNKLKNDFGFTYIFISHDLAVVKYMSDQLVVMNKGKIEEKGEADEIYNTPKTTYTQKLIDAIPKGI